MKGTRKMNNKGTKHEFACNAGKVTEYEVKEHIGTIMVGFRGFSKEVTIVKWSDRQPVFDIRAWRVSDIDGLQYPLRGITFSKDELITANSGLALGVITIDTIKEKFNVCVDSRSANKICEKVHEVLLSMEDSRTTQPQVQIQQNSSADEILKYKNLLDMGVITQEEFEQKKKQLLGL